MLDFVVRDTRTSIYGTKYLVHNGDFGLVVRRVIA